MCSCPPFECTCSRWGFQASPKVANSPPFPAKKLNFYGPAFCEIPSGSGMQSLSIEIDTNKHLNHSNNYGLFPHDIQPNLPPPFVPNVSQMSSFPMVSNQTSCFDTRQSDFYQASTAGFREPNYNSNYSRRSCDRLDHSGQAQLFLPSKRYRSAMESCNVFEKSENDIYCSPVKRIKSENSVTLTDCTVAPNQSMNSRNENTEGLFDESVDLLNSPFETDIYSSLVQRFNDGSLNSTQSQGSLTNLTPTSSVSSNLAELKTAQSQDSRPRSCQEILPGSTPRIVENAFRNCNTEPIQSSTEPFSGISGNSGYFPLHSQCMAQETSNQSCSYDYDQRLSHQQAQTQSQYCNHSINITLRYK